MKTSIIAAVLSLIAALLLFAGCASTGMKAYQKGDYFEACNEAIKMLRGKPDNAEAKQALMKAYPLAQSTTLREIGLITGARDYSKYERVIALYDRLGKLSADIRHCPAAFNIIPQPAEYDKERRAAVEEMARAFYDAGVKALNENTLEQARVAFGYFAKIRKYLPGYADSEQKYEQARQAATLRVIVARPKISTRYQYNADFFYTKLMVDVTKRTYQNLVRFYTPEEAAAEGLKQPDQMLVLNFEDFTIGKSRETSNTTEFRKDNVVVGTVPGPGGRQQDVLGSVRANYTRYRLELISNGAIVVQILDATNSRIVNQRKISGQYVWFSEWAFFNGDERALTSSQIKLTRNRRLEIPSDQDLFYNFANPLYSNTAKYISSIYK